MKGPPAFARLAQPPRHGRNGRKRDGCHRDRGAESHHKGRGNTGKQQALGEGKHQDQYRARTGVDADHKDRGHAAPPAAGAGELASLRPQYSS